MGRGRTAPSRPSRAPRHTLTKHCAWHCVPHDPSTQSGSNLCKTRLLQASDGTYFEQSQLFLVSDQPDYRFALKHLISIFVQHLYDRTTRTGVVQFQRKQYWNLTLLQNWLKKPESFKISRYPWSFRVHSSEAGAIRRVPPPTNWRSQPTVPQLRRLFENLLVTALDSDHGGFAENGKFSCF